MSENEIKFVGVPPFGLPAIQRAQADALEDSVVMTLYAVLPGQGPTPVPIMAQMVPKTALALSAQLSRAGIVAESKARKS